jgi:NADH-quinone oxidoreductase subunit C
VGNVENANSPTSKLSVDAMKAKIATEFPTGVKITDRVAPRRIYAAADKEVLFKFCQFLKDQLKFDHMSCVCGVDRCDKFQTVYHITSYLNECTMELTVDLSRDNPEVDSITPLWGGANWHERETFDMFGIVFKGHPKMERILLPEDYQFFPMRKDCEAGRR